MIIGIVGSIASGKDTVAEYFKQKDFQIISLSDILREIMRKENIETTIPNMTEYGNSLRKEKDNGYLAKLAFEKIDSNNVLITSIRQVGEIDFLKTKPNFYLVKLDAPIKIRLNRLLERNREGDVKNLSELKAVEAKQANGTNGEMNMNKCFAMASYSLINDGTKENLYDQLDKMVKEINNTI